MKPNSRAKIDMLEAQSRGEFGNFLQTYMDPVGQVFPHKDWYTIRNKERDSPHFVPVVRGVDIRSTITRLISAGCDIPTIYVQDIPHPDSRRLLQGELARIGPDLHLSFSTHPTANLRDALTRVDLAASTGSAKGIIVRELVQFYAGQPAWDDLSSLFDKYPDHTIEFTVFDRPTGQFNRQTVIWEVRAY
jgi:hypothetical protein